MASRLESVHDLLASARKARLPAAAAPAPAAPAPEAAAPAPPPAPPRSLEEVEARQAAYVSEALRENAGARFAWAVAYAILHFLLGAAAFYAALVHADAPYSGAAAALRPFRAAVDGGALSESALMASLLLVSLSMVLAALAIYLRSARVLGAAAASLGLPGFSLARALAATPLLRRYWPAWFILLVPALVIAVQAVAERSFWSTDAELVAAFERVTAAQRAEAAEAAAAAAAAKATGSSAARHRGVR